MRERVQGPGPSVEGPTDGPLKPTSLWHCQMVPTVWLYCVHVCVFLRKRERETEKCTWDSKSWMQRDAVTL